MAKSVLEDLFGTGSGNGVNVALTPVTCCECGTPFAVEANLHAHLMRDGQTFYCPNGHSQWYGESEASKLKKQLAQEAKKRERLETSLLAAQRENATLERSRSALRGQITKIKNEVSRGVCPCCGEYFADLHQHMQEKHPDYEHQETEKQPA